MYAHFQGIKTICTTLSGSWYDTVVTSSSKCQVNASLLDAPHKSSKAHVQTLYKLKSKKNVHIHFQGIKQCIDSVVLRMMSY